MPNQYCRGYVRFPLTDLPSGSDVTKVEVRVNVKTSGGSAHLVDAHAYGTNGQDNPETDTPETCYNRCASGNLYINDSTAFRTTGDKWFDLGSQGCVDVENAKSAVNRFAVGFHEEGDNDTAALLYCLFDGVPELYPWLRITYTPPPAVGYHYSDGLVSVSVFAMLMRKAILSVYDRAAG